MLKIINRLKFHIIGIFFLCAMWIFRKLKNFTTFVVQNNRDSMRKVVNFLKNWTLPSAIVGGACIYILFWLVPAFDSFSAKASPFFDAVLPWFLFVILYITFLKIDYNKLRLSWWHLWVSLAQVFMVIALIVCKLYFKMSGNDLTLIICLEMCMIGPCAAASSVVTAKLGGSLESMTTYTFVSNILTAIMIPLLFPLLGTKGDMNFGLTFLTIMWKVCVVLLVPMLLGFLTKRFLPRVQKAITSIPDLGFYLWGCSLSIVTGITFRNIFNSGTTVGFLATIAMLSFGLCVIQFSVGRNIGHFSNSGVEAGQALGQKNTAFAIWVSTAYLIDPLAAVGPGFYIIWQNLINSLELWMYRRKAIKN